MEKSDKDKLKVKLTEGAKKDLDNILDNKDEEGFRIVTSTIKKLKENPMGFLTEGVAIIRGYDQELLEKLRSYQRVLIRGMHLWESEGEEKPGEAFDIEIGRDMVQFHDAYVFYEGKGIGSKRLSREGRKSKSYFVECNFQGNFYEVKLLNETSRKEYLIKSECVGIEEGVLDKDGKGH